MKITIDINPSEFSQLAKAPIRQAFDRFLSAFSVRGGGVTKAEVEQMLEEYLKAKE